MKRIKVHYWNIIVPQGAPSVATTLERLKAQSLQDRLKNCGSHKVRLDEVNDQSQSGGQVFWHMKFSKFREDNYPGVSAVREAAKTYQDLRVAEVVEMDVLIENGSIIAYRTKLRLSFKSS